MARQHDCSDVTKKGLRLPALAQRSGTFFGSFRKKEGETPSAKGSRPRLGQTMIAMESITESQLKQTLAEQKRSGGLIGEILLHHGFISLETLMVALAKQFEMEFAGLKETPSDPEALEAVSETIAVKYKILPIRVAGDRLTVLITEPQVREKLHDVSVLLGLRLHSLLTATDDIREEIKIRYHAVKMKKRRPRSVIMSSEDRAELAAVLEEADAPPFDEGAPEQPSKDEKPVPKPLERDTRAERFRQIEAQITGMPVVKLVSTIIEGAINSGATDIHLDPEDPQMRIRYRIDGTLHDVMHIPKEVEPAVVSRIKIMADIDITETRHPQDGHISLEMGDHECDIRVATLPTFLGERVVLRLLDQSALFSGISELGLEPDDEQLLRRIISEAYGMILVTGPTGSGKTTTLYTALTQKDVKTESIVTLEDPVEYQLSGINQVQIDNDIDLTFARTLRAALRQDIDVLLIGEIRDSETAHIAIRAAMTGHLVFSTLHTNDAAEAISTLRNMGVQPYLVASALIAVIGQRLVRKICPNCKTPYTPDQSLITALGLSPAIQTLYRGKGCESCYHTGYSGRTAIFEILAISPEIRKLIENHESVEKISAAANLRTLADRCRLKVEQGVVTAEEFLRVIRA